MTDEGAEAPRSEPDFRVYVQRGLGDRSTPWADEIDITHAVMDVYDIAVNSMDFGSGFLSTEEVGNLRVLGRAIGAERFDYQNDKCLACGHEYASHHNFIDPGEGKPRLYDQEFFRCYYYLGKSRRCSCENFISPVGDLIWKKEVK